MTSIFRNVSSIRGVMVAGIRQARTAMRICLSSQTCQLSKCITHYYCSYFCIIKNNLKWTKKIIEIRLNGQMEHSIWAAGIKYGKKFVSAIGKTDFPIDRKIASSLVCMHLFLTSIYSCKCVLAKLNLYL